VEYGIILTSDEGGTVIVTGALSPVKLAVAVTPRLPLVAPEGMETFAWTSWSDESAQTLAVSVRPPPLCERVATNLVPVASTPSTMAVPNEVAVA